MLRLAPLVRIGSVLPGFVAVCALGAAAPAGAFTISPFDLIAGQPSVALADATVTANGGVFGWKSEFGFDGTGVSAGYVGGEIDTSGESIDFVFNAPVVLSNLDLTFLFAAPSHEDRVNEVAKVLVSSGGISYEATLTVDTTTTATWSFAGGVASNLSIATQAGAGAWSVATPFGDLAIDSMSLLPVDASGDANYRNADYAFGGLTATVIPEPGTMLLVAAGLAGLTLAGRKRTD